MLDLEADDLQSIVNAVVDRLVLQDLLQEEDKGKMLRTLLLKHKYVAVITAPPVCLAGFCMVFWKC